MLAAGVVHHDVETAEFAGDVGDPRLERRTVADVEDASARRHAARTQLRDRRFDFGRDARAHRNRRALIGQRLGDRAADALGPAGHDRAPSAQA